MKVRFIVKSSTKNYFKVTPVSDEGVEWGFGSAQTRGKVNGDLYVAKELAGGVENPKAFTVTIEVE